MVEHVTLSFNCLDYVTFGKLFNFIGLKGELNELMPVQHFKCSLAYGQFLVYVSCYCY